jgi:hypothetical protein
MISPCSYSVVNIALVANVVKRRDTKAVVQFDINAASV